MSERLFLNILLLLYFIFLIFAFQRGRTWRINRKRNKVMTQLNKYFDSVPTTKAGKIKWAKITQELRKQLPNQEIEKLIREIGEINKNDAQ